MPKHLMAFILGVPKPDGLWLEGDKTCLLGTLYVSAKLDIEISGNLWLLFVSIGNIQRYYRQTELLGCLSNWCLSKKLLPYFWANSVVTVLQTGNKSNTTPHAAEPIYTINKSWLLYTYIFDYCWIDGCQSGALKIMWDVLKYGYF